VHIIAYSDSDIALSGQRYRNIRAKPGEI